MNNEDFARLFHKVFKEQLAKVTGSEVNGPSWDNVSSELQEVYLNTAEVMLEQITSPLQIELEKTRYELNKLQYTLST